MSNESSIDKAIQSAKKLTNKEKSRLSQDEALKKALELVASCSIAMLGSNSASGYPNIKAMLKMETEGIKTVWFSTNTSSKKVSQLKENPRACVYFHNEQNFKGLLLVGEVEILTDIESRRRLWKNGCEIYYPLGVTDPDYTVLRFTAQWANYYEGLNNVSFDV